jgi:hypothetical protein
VEQRVNIIETRHVKCTWLVHAFSVLFTTLLNASEAVFQMLVSRVYSESDTRVIFLSEEVCLNPRAKEVPVGLHLHVDLKLKGSHLCVLKFTRVEAADTFC